MREAQLTSPIGPWEMQARSIRAPDLGTVRIKATACGAQYARFQSRVDRRDLGGGRAATSKFFSKLKGNIYGHN